MKLTVGSLFSGIGGFDLGLERAGFEIGWQVEIDPFCRKVLDKHWPDVKKCGDIREVNLDDLEPVDLVCGGFPCQDLSVAGKRKGLAGERSGLFFELLRIADAMPSAWVLAENVPGLLSSAGGADFATVLGELSGFFPAVPEDGWRNSGLCAGSKGCVAWRVLDAQYFGVAQRRRRVFIVRSPAGTGAFEVLFEPDCLPGNPPPSREKGAGTSRCLTKGARMDGDTETFVTQALTDALGNGGPDDNRAQAGFYVAAPLTSKPWADNESQESKPVVADVCGPLTAGKSSGWKVNAENAADGQLVVAGTLAPGAHAGGYNGQDAYTGMLVAHALTGRHDSSEDGTGRGVPLTVVPTLRTNYRNNSNPATEADMLVCGYQNNDLAHAVRSNPSRADKPDSSTYIVQESREGVGLYETAGSLRAGAPGTQPCGSMVMAVCLGGDPVSAADLALPETARNGDRGTIAFMERTRRDGRNIDIQPDLAYTLTNPGEGGRPSDRQIAGAFGVRRLTPTECERLQGFPDGWTLLDGKTPDSPRYRALGNAVCVNVAEWIGKRLMDGVEHSEMPAMAR